MLARRTVQLTALAFAAVCSLIFFTWQLRTRRLFGDGERVQRYDYGFDDGDAAADAGAMPPVVAHRLVVFGDSLSHATASESKRGRGRVWTDVLCDKLGCICENHAQSAPNAIAVVDTKLAKSTAVDGSASASRHSFLPDLRTQIDRFELRERERVAGMTADMLQWRRRNTVFAVAFGMWDLWRLVEVGAASNRSVNAEVKIDMTGEANGTVLAERKKQHEMGEEQPLEKRASLLQEQASQQAEKRAERKQDSPPPNAEMAKVRRTVDALFGQISRLAAIFSPVPVRIIVLGAPDVTLLPAYDVSRASATTRHRHDIELPETWNAALWARAAEGLWASGTLGMADKMADKVTGKEAGSSVYVFNTTTFLAEQMRRYGVWLTGFDDTPEFERTGPVWENVVEGCMGKGGDGHDGEAKPCEKPERYLFWDDMHVGGTMQALLGETISTDVGELWFEQEQS